MRKRCLVLLMAAAGLSGCGSIFPIWSPNYFDDPPAELGPFQVNEFRVDVPNGADGSPAGITVFEPVDAEGARPALLWVLGSNVQAYYHQSFHETMASWGYVVITSDGRLLTLTDFQYHKRTIDLARQALDLGLSGELGVNIDPDRIAAGGYSIGGTLAIFTAALDGEVDAIVAWAPTGSPFWTGVTPDTLFPEVRVPALFLLAELDNVAPVEGFPREAQAKMTQSEVTEVTIPNGLHLYFQQPIGADRFTDPQTSLTRFQQQGIAIYRTRSWLDEQFDIARDEAESEAQEP